MKSLVVTLALVVATVTLFVLTVTSSIFGSGDGSVRGELAPAVAATNDGPERAPAQLENPTLDASATVEPEKATPAVDVVTREDATGREPWSLIVDIVGFNELVAEPVELEVSALGHDKTLRLSTEENRRYAFDISSISRPQPFDTPSINVLVDHDEFFLWDETIDGVRENDAVVFRATIELQPFRARLTGRVIVPANHEPLPHVAAFLTDDGKRPDRKPVSVVQCAGDHTFELWIEDPSLVFLVAASPGVRPDTLKLNVQAGTTQDELVLSLQPGYSLTGWVKLEGEPLRETQSLFARFVPPESEDDDADAGSRALLAPDVDLSGFEGRLRYFTTRQPNGMTTHYVDDIPLAFQRTRFYAYGESAVVEAGGAFTITGLDRAEYELIVSNEGSPTSPFEYQRSLGRFKAPAQGLFIEYESVEVSLEFRVDGVEQSDVRHSISLDSKADRFNSLSRTTQDRIRIPRGATASVQIWSSEYEERSMEIDPEQADAQGVIVIELTRKETP